MEVTEQIFQKAALLRGYYLNKVIYIEKAMELIIASHFCKNEEKVIEFIDLLLGDTAVSFESKRGVFESIIKTHHSEYYEKNKDKFASLTTVQKQRNRFAHLILELSNEAVEKFIKDGTIGFVKYGHKTNTIWYTPEEEKRIISALEDLNSWLAIVPSN